MTKYGLAADVPWWLAKLPAGKYTLTELEQVTGRTKTNIYMRLESLEVGKVMERKGSYWMNVYDWKGPNYYWLRNYEEKQKRLEKEWGGS